MKRRVYIDNSVLGGFYDEDFQEDTKDFFKGVEQGTFDVFFSEINETELFMAPEHVQKVKDRIPDECYYYVELDEESKKLGDSYLKEKILGPASMNDAYHIAIATINRVDVVVSWNFKHIVNFDKIQQFNSVNLRLGFPVIDIRTPKEMIHYENR